MMVNGGPKTRIPPHQIGILACKTCEEPGVWQVLSCVQMVFDKLAPDKVQPVPVPMYRCVKCGGFLIQDKDGSYKVVHMTEGEDWKGS